MVPISARTKQMAMILPCDCSQSPSFLPSTLAWRASARWRRSDAGEGFSVVVVAAGVATVSAAGLVVLVSALTSAFGSALTSAFGSLVSAAALTADSMAVGKPVLTTVGRVG